MPETSGSTGDRHTKKPPPHEAAGAHRRVAPAGNGNVLEHPINFTTPEHRALRSLFGHPAFEAGAAVEVLNDNGQRFGPGLVARARLTELGWRYLVAAYGLGRVEVTGWNLRAMPPILTGKGGKQLPLDVAEGPRDAG